MPSDQIGTDMRHFHFNFSMTVGIVLSKRDPHFAGHGLYTIARADSSSVDTT